MQLTLLSAAAAVVATVSAKSAVQLNSECDHSKPYARIINRCDYPVHLWSVYKGIGCPSDGMVTLQKGEIYSENYQRPEGGDQGVSIKVSKTEQCKGNDIVQLEYFLEERPGKEMYWSNYLDVSYVDCLNGDCPTKKEGYYLQAGSQTGAATASAGNTRCPVLSCSDEASCAKMSYILPDDVQTKTCDLASNLDFYMCGSQAPSAGDNKPAAPEKPKSDSKPSSTEDDKMSAAAVTKAPEVKEPLKAPKVTTKVVYVTEYKNVEARNEHAHAHAHAHARHHQAFHA